MNKEQLRKNVNDWVRLRPIAYRLQASGHPLPRAYQARENPFQRHADEVPYRYLSGHLIYGFQPPPC